MAFTNFEQTLFLGSFRLNIIVLYLFMYLLSVLRNISNISISMLATSFATSLSVISKSSQSHTLEKWKGSQSTKLLCSTALTDWDKHVNTFITAEEDKYIHRVYVMKIALFVWSYSYLWVLLPTSWQCYWLEHDWQVWELDGKDAL